MKRLVLVLTPAEKTTMVQRVKAEGCLSQNARMRQLIHNADRVRSIWPPESSGISPSISENCSVAEYRALQD